jgi:hypothetical protein
VFQLDKLRIEIPPYTQDVSVEADGPEDRCEIINTLHGAGLVAVPVASAPIGVTVKIPQSVEPVIYFRGGVPGKGLQEGQPLDPSGLLLF